MICNALQHLLRLPNLAEELATKGRQAAALQEALLSALLAEHGLEAAAAQQLLLDLLAKLQLAERAEGIAAAVLARGGEAEPDSALAVCLQQALRCVCQPTILTIPDRRSLEHLFRLRAISRAVCAGRGAGRWMRGTPGR